MDKMKITILDDGTLKIETDQISPANHMTAEALLRNTAMACGGEQTRVHKHGVVGSMLHAAQHALGMNHHHH